LESHFGPSASQSNFCYIPLYTEESEITSVNVIIQHKPVLGIKKFVMPLGELYESALEIKLNSSFWWTSLDFLTWSCKHSE